MKVPLFLLFLILCLGCEAMTYEDFAEINGWEADVEFFTGDSISGEVLVVDDVVFVDMTLIDPAEVVHIEAWIDVEEPEPANWLSGTSDVV